MSPALLEDAINAFVTLFVVIDPIGTAPLFVALTVGRSAAERWRIALRSIGLAAGILVLFGLAGEAILNFVGISMPAFRIAGGLLLFLTALDMLFERRTARRKRNAARDKDTDPSVFPIAIPLVAGPGAIASMILLIDQQTGDPAGQAMVLGVCFGVLAIALALFSLGGVIERGLGRLGTMVVTRLLGMLLAALSVQFVLDGLTEVGVVAAR